MRLVRRSLPPQARPRSLLRLEAEIAAARARARRAALAASLGARGRDAAWARGMLELAERRLERLARSREVLLRGEEGAGDDEPERRS